MEVSHNLHPMIDPAFTKVSGNDMVGTCFLPLSELLADAPRPSSDTGLHGNEEDGKHDMKEFTVRATTLCAILLTPGPASLAY